MRRWVFERHAGLVLVRYEHQIGSVLVRVIEADQFIEAAPGLAFPANVVDTVRAESGERMVRRVIRCSRAVANSPSFDESCFVIRFPPGTSVRDYVNDRQFRIGPGSDELTELIDDQIRAARSETARSNPRSPSWLWWGAGSVCVVLGLWLVKSLWRRSRVKESSLLVAFALLSSAPELAGQDVWMTRQPTTRAQNCGVSAALCALRAFGVTGNPDVLASELGCGEQWEEQTDLDGIAEVLRSAGRSLESWHQR